MLERGRTSSPVQVSAPRVTSAGQGSAPACTSISSKGSWLDPSSCMGAGPLPWDWHPAHHLLLSYSATASVTGDSGQPQLTHRWGRQRWLEMLGQLRAPASPFGGAQASATGPSPGGWQAGGCPKMSPWVCSHPLFCVGPLLAHQQPMCSEKSVLAIWDTV